MANNVLHNLRQLLLVSAVRRERMINALVRLRRARGVNTNAADIRRDLAARLAQRQRRS